MVDQENSDSDDEAEEDNDDVRNDERVEAPDRDDDKDKGEEMLRRSSRLRAGVKKPDLEAMELVKKEDIPEGCQAHNTHLFTVEKFTADGKHDKYKSRLVTHRNEQDATVYALVIPDGCTTITDHLSCAGCK